MHERLPERFLDIRYEALIADPMAQIRRIYDFVGLDLTPAAEERMREWATENSRDKRPVHGYTLEQFGFSEAGLREQFASYQAFLARLD
jgi:LPS sulfotransferase NodH